MDKRKVNLYGTGINAALFLMQSPNLKIETVIEGKKERISSNQLFLGNKVCYIEDAEKMLYTNYTVVAASESVYFEIKKILETLYGLVEYENFEFYKTYGKKIAFVYGNCHMDAVKQMLSLSGDFDDKYGIYPMPAVCEIKSKDYLLEDFPLEKADIFIHQCIWEKNFYGIEFASSNLLKRLKNGCRIIGMPNLYRMPKFLYPQIPDEFDQQYYKEFGGVCYFNFRDRFIEQNSELSIDEICELIDDDKLIPKADIIDERDNFFEKLVSRESEWDIKISDFLRENINVKQCFYDPNHPTGAVMKYIITILFELLGIKRLPDMDVVSEMSTFELPIYAAVEKALELHYRPEVIRKNGLNLRRTQMDKKEYIKQYLAWNCSALEPDYIEHIVYRR